MKKRSEIEEKYKWDLTKFCANDEEFYKRLEKLKGEISKFKDFENKLSNDDVLFKCLEFETNLLKEFSLISLYCELNLCGDMSSTNYNEMSEKLSLVSTQYSVASSFVDVEISKFSKEKLAKLMKEPKFKNYKRFFELVLREKRHVLSKREEKLISHMGEFLGSASSNFDKFSIVDMKFDKIKDGSGKTYELTNSNYQNYFTSTDRTLRKNAYETLNGTYGKYINFLANNYISDVKQDCVFAKVRGYKSALSASIYNEEASEKVYQLLIKKVRENVGLLHEYFELKRKALSLKKIAIYDAFAPIGDSEKKFTFEQAVEILKDALSVLGEKYVQLLDRAVKERWIDAFANENKSTGAFSTGTYGATPVVLMNFEGNYESVFTLAHELGHAMHTYFSNETQPIQTADYRIFVAEVASITNELLLLQHFLKNEKDEQNRLFLIDKFLSELMRSTLFRQTRFAEFEAKIHEDYEKGEPLTAEKLCQISYDLIKFYVGDKVEVPQASKFEWARIPHFYNSFYVYKYATGFICACKISREILKDDKFFNKYIKFLSSGSSTDPISLLKIADCDLTKAQTFDDALLFCREFLDTWKNS